MRHPWLLHFRPFILCCAFLPKIWLISNGSRASRLSRGSGDSAASSARTEHAALRSSTSVRSRCSISESASTSDSRGTKGAFAVYLLAQSERVRAIAP